MSKVTVARVLLTAGMDELKARYEVVSGGLGADRSRILGLVESAEAVVADPTVRVDRELLDAAGSQLRVVANFAVGTDNIDLEACGERGVTVTNTPDVLTNATAELAVALTLAAHRRMPEAERDLRQGRWQGWDPGAGLGEEVSGSTVGVVGMGRIGGRYAELLRGFGVEVLYTARSPKPEWEERVGARRVDLEELLRESHTVSLHAPATPETHHMIGQDALDTMRRDAVLVNTGRGSLIDTEALIATLRAGGIAAAGLDVYEDEPKVDPRLLELSNVVLLPHIGSATRKARDAMARTVAANVIAALSGEAVPNPVAGGRRLTTGD